MAATYSRKAGPGRPKGVPNRTTAAAREAIESAFVHLEKQPNKGLKAWALANETLFYTQLFPKLLPLQLNHADHEGNALVITWQDKPDA